MNGPNEILIQLETCLTTIQSPTTPTQQRVELEGQLQQFQRTPTSCATSCQILQSFLEHKLNSNLSLHAAHYLASVVEYWGGDLANLMENFSQNQVSDFLSEVRLMLLEAFENNNNNNNNNNNSPIYNIIQQQLKVAYCRMGRCLWGNPMYTNYLRMGDFVADAIVLASNNIDINPASSSSSPFAASQAAGCAVLATFCEELSRDDLTLSSPIPSQRSVQLRQQLSQALPQIISCISHVIVSSSSPTSTSTSTSSSNNNHANSIHTTVCIRDCLRCITAILGFSRSMSLKHVDISAAVSVDLIRSLFAVIDAAARQDSHAGQALHVITTNEGEGAELVVEAGADALDCISEVITRACWPKGQAENFVVELSSHALTSLSIECQAIEAGRRGASDDNEPICIERYRSQISHFLDTFCIHQLARASALPANVFDMAMFLQLMARYTFALPSGLEQTDCLISWIRLAEFAANSESLIAAHGVGLSEVLVAVMNLNLFTTNAKKLSGLDYGQEVEFPDESVEAGNGSGDENDVMHFGGSTHTWSSNRGNASRSNSDMSNSSHYTLPPNIDSALRQTERGTLLAESCIFSVSLCTISAPCAVACFERLLSVVKELLQRLQVAMSSASMHMANGNGSEQERQVVDRLCWDICACFRLLDSGQVALAALSHRQSIVNSGDTSALREYWELCEIVMSSTETLLSSRSWANHSNLGYILSTGCSCLGTLSRGLCALASQQGFAREPAENFALKLLEFCRRALAEFSTLPAPSFVASSVCDLLKRCADSLFTSLISPSVLKDGETAFAIKCRECALDAIRNRSALSQRQLQLVYRSSVKLIFPFGSVNNLSILNPASKTLYEQEASCFVSVVVKVLCDDLVAKCQEVKMGSSVTPVRTLQKSAVVIERVCRSLASICDEVGSMGDGAKKVLASAIGPCMEQAVELTGLYTTWGMHGGGIVVAAAASLLNLQVKVISTLNKETGVEYQTKVLATVLNALNSSETVPTAALSHGKIMVQRALLELFITVFNTRDKKLFELLHQTCALLISTTIPLCKNSTNAPELLPSLLRLIHVVLTMQWRNFSSVVVAPGKAGEKLASLIGPRITKVDDKFTAEFDLFLQILLDCMKTPDLPPSIVQDAVSIVLDLGSILKLFQVHDFETRVKPVYLSTIMQVLLNQSQPMHVDSLTGLLREIANADMQSFFSEFLPSLVSTMNVPNDSKEVVLRSWPHDLYSFSSNCHDFLCECRFAMNRQRHLQERQ